LVAIALIALDCGWLRNVYNGRGSALGFGPGDAGVNDLGVLAMLNVLVVALLAARDRTRAFLVGFEIAGVLAIAVYVGTCWLFPEAFAYGFVSMGIQRVHDVIMTHLPSWTPIFDRNKLYPAYILAPLTCVYMVVLSLPLLLFALGGAFVA